MNVFTIGHSTRTFDEFVACLSAQKVSLVVDVRTIPGSRHNPQYGQQVLEENLTSVGIGYVWMKNLGGLRHSVKGVESINGAWRNASFRNYADYMQTDEFGQGLQELIALAKDHTIVLMCAEAVPWRCHRSLIADALTVRGIVVHDIFSAVSVKPHTLTSFARVAGTRVWYPVDEGTS